MVRVERLMAGAKGSGGGLGTKRNLGILATSRPVSLNVSGGGGAGALHYPPDIFRFERSP